MELPASLIKQLDRHAANYAAVSSKQVSQELKGFNSSKQHTRAQKWSFN
jgi:hypothetical protein